MSVPGKQVRDSVAFVIFNDDRSMFRVVQRPANDENLPNAWGLPAGSLKEGETSEECVLRSGREKLGVGLEIVGLLGEGELERPSYTLHMKEYEVRIVSGEPSVPQPYPDVTQYQAMRWGTADDLVMAASKGSLCCRIYLEHVGRTW
jgi:ADP-ribose pyrophosphatase YjhB (NUDIX family)